MQRYNDADFKVLGSTEPIASSISRLYLFKFLEFLGFSLYR